MLSHIHIQNLATIAELQLDFLSGTTVMTGETGAGKSILIDAIELALGARATGEVVRQDKEKADISLCFDLQNAFEAKQWLKNYELDQGNECILRRTVAKDGKSRSYINNMPITLQPLREFSELLIDIHGQHEHQSLLKPDMQRNLLDRYASHEGLVAQVREIAHDIQTLEKEVNDLKQRATERKTRSEFLTFQLQELAELQLTPQEFHSLDLEHKQLAHAEELLAKITEVAECISEQDDHNVINLLHKSLHTLESIQRIDPKISTWVEALKNILIQLSDTENELHRYLSSIELDPTRLQNIEERISKIFNLARKHKVEPQELYDLQQKFNIELLALETSDERIAELGQRLQQLEKDYLGQAKKLSDSRIKFAKKLSQEITQTIHRLALPHGEFQVFLETENTLKFSPWGFEKVIFLIKTNLGLAAQPLAKIASGGELSRVSLAIHLATAHQHTTPILIFDEVDVGISGSTAEIVGQLLRDLGRTHQVICITHQPQVAALGHQHLCVKKIMSKQTTFTHIACLTHPEKIQEIARMLGGSKITETTLAHAREMVETN